MYTFWAMADSNTAGKPRKLRSGRGVNVHKMNNKTLRIDFAPWVGYCCRWQLWGKKKNLKMISPTLQLDTVYYQIPDVYVFRAWFLVEKSLKLGTKNTYSKTNRSIMLRLGFEINLSTVLSNSYIVFSLKSVFVILKTHFKKSYRNYFGCSPRIIQFFLFHKSFF